MKRIPPKQLRKCGKCFSNYKSMGFFSDVQLAAYSKVGGQIWPNFELVRGFMHVIVTCIKRIECKKNENKWQHPFPRYNLMGSFSYNANQRSEPVCPETLCSLSPIPMMLQIKLDCDSVILKFKCVDIATEACTDARMDGRRLDSHPISSYCEPSAQLS